jgi:ADP-heptose:LPS heptosyltransferase
MSRVPLILKLNLSPGDSLVASAAIQCLHETHPGVFKTAFEGTAKWLYKNNKYIEELSPYEINKARTITLSHPIINKSNVYPYHFTQAIRKNLEKELDIDIYGTTLTGSVYLSDKEKQENPIIKGDYWVIFAGGKYDFTCKWWNPDYYQQVVDYFNGKICFVQVGNKNHFHPKLKNTINMIGKTPDRELIKLIYHSVGVITPVSFGMHLASAVPSTKMDHRACVVIAGGREPVQWEMYPWHQFLHCVGTMDCCSNGGCWKSRCQKVGDKDKKDIDERRCKYPVPVYLREVECQYHPLYISQCMYDIKPEEVIHSIKKWYKNGYLSYDK